MEEQALIQDDKTGRRLGQCWSPHPELVALGCTRVKVGYENLSKVSGAFIRKGFTFD